MYIEYITPQRVADPKITEYKSKGSDFRPTWLVRTSDWEKAPGLEAIDGYHTLSYVWEQSGEKVLQEDGEYGLKDEGHHRIVTTEKERRRISNLFGHRQQVPVATNEVTYDKLLQQICQDFGIKYLWYDKVCIDQTNKDEKKREIKQMHLIYSNACYTVAFVPEINIEDPKDFDRESWASGNTKAKDKALRHMWKSLWWKRSWTLEEVMMSTRILILGRNTHFWSLPYFKQGDKVKENDFLASLVLGFKERSLKSANQVLYYAHFRTSTKEHDKIFALANIFNGIVDIDIDYDSDVLTAMARFYRHLGEKDLSIMCFGSNLHPSGALIHATTMGTYNLPSWTGVAGRHSMNPIADIALDQNYAYTIDDSMRLHLKCQYYTIRPSKYDDRNIYLYGNEERMKKADENYYKMITSMDDLDGDESEALDWSQWIMPRTTDFFPTHYHKPDDHTPFLSPVLPLSLTEECDECVVLGVVFDNVVPKKVNDEFVGHYHDYLSPVARKSTDGSSYKIIGVIVLKHFQDDEPRPTPQEVMDKMFNGLGCETHDFHIK